MCLTFFLWRWSQADLGLNSVCPDTFLALGNLLFSGSVFSVVKWALYTLSVRVQEENRHHSSYFKEKGISWRKVGAYTTKGWRDRNQGPPPALWFASQKFRKLLLLRARTFQKPTFSACAAQRRLKQSGACGWLQSSGLGSPASAHNCCCRKRKTDGICFPSSF